MKALEIRQKYAKYLLQNGFSYLVEHPVLNSNQNGTLFNGSALTPNLEYILETRLRPSNNLFTQQRVFHVRNADKLVGLPLFTIFKVMMSFYQFDQSDLQESFRIGLALLTEILKVPKQDLFLAIPKRSDLKRMAVTNKFPAENIISWSEYPKFRVDNRLQGFYCKIFLKYKHGVIPVWDLVTIEKDDTSIITDNCSFLERLTFILQKKQTWYQTEIFLPLVKAVEDQAGSAIFVNHFGYLIASVMRSLVLALADGAKPSNREAGYVVRKWIRWATYHSYKYGHDISLCKLVIPSLECLKNVGYSWNDIHEEIEHIFVKEEEVYKKLRNSNLKFLQKQLRLFESGKRGTFTSDELKCWRDSRGIHEDLALDFLKNYALEPTGHEDDTSSQKTLFISGYQFDPKAIIEAKSFLHEIEKARCLQVPLPQKHQA